jgi:hypothetical protein
MMSLRRWLGPSLLLGALALSSCSSGGGANPLATPGGSPTASASDTATPSESPSDSASPATASPDTASPDTASPGTGSATPSGTVSGSPTGSTGPTGPAALCTTVTPLRVMDVNIDPRRITEVVTVVSDGRTLTSGTRDQTDFLTPTLTGPDGTSVTDDGTTRGIAALVAGQKHRVLLTRPDPPDTTATVAKKPFNTTGTFVIFNASSQLTATVVVLCSGQQQNWTFVAEADPSVGQVNCAVEPSKANGLARQAYQNNC